MIIFGYLTGESIIRGTLTGIKKKPIGNLIAESLTYDHRKLAPRTKMFRRAQEEVKKELEEEARQETVYESLTHRERAREEISELSYWRLLEESWKQTAGQILQREN